MRAFLLFMVIAGLAGLFFYQKQQSAKPDSAPAPSQAQVAKATSAPALTPAPRGQASEHNWMKRALDRAADVRDNARRQTQDSQNP